MCQHCGAEFTRHNSLKRHIEVGAAHLFIFFWNFCIYSGIHPKPLQLWLLEQRSHYNLFPKAKHKLAQKYKCSQCDKRFNYSWEVSIHLKNSHTAEKGYEVGANILCLEMMFLITTIEECRD